MVTGTKGLELIKLWEGLRLKAYLCTAGYWTIGYGSIKYSNTNTPVKKGDIITKEQAEAELKVDLQSFEKIMDAAITIDLTQNQFDALVSFWFNTGGSNTLAKLINSKADKKDIYRWWTTHYITSNGKPTPGLVSRRKAEADLFFS